MSDPSDGSTTAPAIVVVVQPADDSCAAKDEAGALPENQSNECDVHDMQEVDEKAHFSREKIDELKKEKLRKLREAEKRAREFRREQEEKRRLERDKARQREAEHRAVVEERRRHLLDEENARRQARLKRTAERAEVQLPKSHHCHKSASAGCSRSSNTDMVSPTATGCIPHRPHSAAGNLPGYAAPTVASQIRLRRGLANSTDDKLLTGNTCVCYRFRNVSPIDVTMTIHLKPKCSNTQAASVQKSGLASHRASRSTVVTSKTTVRAQSVDRDSCRTARDSRAASTQKLAPETHRASRCTTTASKTTLRTRSADRDSVRIDHGASVKCKSKPPCVDHVHSKMKVRPIAAHSASTSSVSNGDVGKRVVTSSVSNSDVGKTIATASHGVARAGSDSNLHRQGRKKRKQKTASARVSTEYLSSNATKKKELESKGSAMKKAPVVGAAHGKNVGKHSTSGAEKTSVSVHLKTKPASTSNAVDYKSRDSHHGAPKKTESEKDIAEAKQTDTAAYKVKLTEKRREARAKAAESDLQTVKAAAKAESDMRLSCDDVVLDVTLVTVTMAPDEEDEEAVKLAALEEQRRWREEADRLEDERKKKKVPTATLR